MKTASHALLVALTLFALSTPAYAGSLAVLTGEKNAEVTSDKSQITFVSTAPAEKIVGTAEGISGAFRMNMGDVSQTSGTLSFPVERMNTGNKLRDKHMQGADWLNAPAHPQITFRIDKLADIKLGEKQQDKQAFQAMAHGAVTVNGVEAPSQAAVTVTVLASGRVKIELTKLAVKLADHKVAGKQGAIGSKVGQTIDITGTIYATVR